MPPVRAILGDPGPDLGGKCKLGNTSDEKTLALVGGTVTIIDIGTGTKKFNCGEHFGAVESSPDNKHIMVTMSLSLLKRVRSGTETQSWNRFVRLYTPLIYRWIRTSGVPTHDANDTVQEVFRAVVRALPTFEYEKPGGFGRWLRAVTNNKCRDYYRHRTRNPAVTNSELVVSDLDNVDEIAKEEYRQMLARQALHIMQCEFEPTTWRACWLHCRIRQVRCRNRWGSQPTQSTLARAEFCGDYALNWTDSGSRLKKNRKW